MIKVDDALKIILGAVKHIESENTPLIKSLGRVLSKDIYAGSDIPGFDNSAMDGYAVYFSDTIGASKVKPKTLEVICDIKAGDSPKVSLKENQAARIMTGAIIPKGADSVIMVEDTERGSRLKAQGSREKQEYVKIFKEVKRGDNIRKKGEDIKKGELVIPCGKELNSAHIGILASLGASGINVYKRPRVAILATGDEVIEIDKELTPGKLRNSNTYTLYSQVLKCGAIPKNLGIAKDKPEQLEKKIKEGLDCDIIITSGGVSVGDYDLVKYILAKMGTDIKFWQVAMRPGKPLVFGVIKGKPVLGLPGNPVSSMISFEVFVRPAILRMMGQIHEERRDIDAVLEEDIVKKKGLRCYLRAHTYWKDGVYLTRTTGPQGSAILKSMADANSIIIVPEEEEKIEKGVRVTVRFLD
ncbi:MAG: molybdopterin molybdotransferase MoeA [Candidatus Omnitrophota bacterium]|nr:molybdopterin molybdotransferase MoeA [Candidatus Omnitrophota bacterium]